MNCQLQHSTAREQIHRAVESKCGLWFDSAVIAAEFQLTMMQITEAILRPRIFTRRTWLCFLERSRSGLIQIKSAVT